MRGSGELQRRGECGIEGADDFVALKGIILLRWIPGYQATAIPSCIVVLRLRTPMYRGEC